MAKLTPTFEKLFRLMAAKRASDLYLSAGAPVMVRIEGVAHPFNAQPLTASQLTEWLTEFVADEAQWERFTHERELNFAVPLAGIGNFRCNLFWQRGTPAAVMRYIPLEIPSLTSLNLPPILQELALAPRGLVLVVGATGSGKSTTLASMIDYRSSERSGHILTVEDPVEFLFRHKKSLVNQRDVGTDTRSWSSSLQNAMRQAPDCILIGEIRNRETMEAALQYALTGHLVLASLHANTSYHALNRIVNFFPIEARSLLFSDLAVALRAIVAQRLVPSKTGRRYPALEVMINTALIAEAIEKGDLFAVREALERSLAAGSQTFEEALAQLVTQGIVARDVAMNFADSPSNLAWRLDNAQRSPQGRGEPPQRSAEEQPVLLGTQTPSSDTAVDFSRFRID
ncbi:PilT/PilU family type 4a pilus ATPase [Hydrogenophilus islandicus]